jgi:hypothetical protein
MLRRLLRVRSLEEEQLKTALELHLAELRRLMETKSVAAERDRRSRALVLESVQKGELCDRMAGLEEAKAAKRLASALTIEIKKAELRSEELRTRYAAKRAERRQVKTLLDAAVKEDELLNSRRAQEALDDGHRSRALQAATREHPATNVGVSGGCDCVAETRSHES